jgi:hypothetical protein
VFERQLNLVAGLVNQHQKSKRLLEIQVYRWKKKLRVNCVAAIRGIIPIRHTNRRKLFQISKNRPPACTECARKLVGSVPAARLHRRKNLHNAGYSADLHKHLRQINVVTSLPAVF